MFKSLLLSTILLVSGTAMATTEAIDAIAGMGQEVLSNQIRTFGLPWQKGDRNEYKMDGAMGLLSGTMVMEVTEINNEGIWVEQTVEAGAMGKKQSSTLFDKDTGAVKKIIMDGKEQEIPKNNIEVVETKEDKITVPAGTFECIHVKLRDKEANQDVNMWANPQLIPLTGMLKMIRPFQFGEIQAELVRFVKH